MELSSEFSGRYIRVVAVISLLLGLNDAARLLGVQTGSESPLTILGVTGFTLLGVFCLCRLFAAVGLWIKASWGAVLLVGSTAVELGLFLTGSSDVQMTWFGFAVRALLLLSLIVIFSLGVRLRHLRSQD
ncbi:MAG: hypothetical protein JWR75_1123 [Devosia sp.]|nr:hypothetical protein [Devosia sp.]